MAAMKVVSDNILGGSTVPASIKPMASDLTTESGVASATADFSWTCSFRRRCATQSGFLAPFKFFSCSTISANIYIPTLLACQWKSLQGSAYMFFYMFSFAGVSDLPRTCALPRQTRVSSGPPWRAAASSP